MLHVSPRSNSSIIIDTVGPPPFWWCFSICVHVVPWDHGAVRVVSKTSKHEVTDDERSEKEGGVNNSNRRVAHYSADPDHVRTLLTVDEKPRPKIAAQQF